MFKNRKNYEGANLQLFQNLDECFFNQIAVLQFILLCIAVFRVFYIYLKKYKSKTPLLFEASSLRECINLHIPGVTIFFFLLGA